MGLFSKQKKETPLLYPPEDFEPVLRCSICTGEQVACMRERATGRLHEIMLLRTEEDLAVFCRGYGLRADEIRKVY